jgi:hypothetical protein
VSVDHTINLTGSAVSTELGRAITRGVSLGVFLLPKGPLGRIRLSPSATRKGGRNEVVYAPLAFLTHTYLNGKNAIPAAIGSKVAVRKHVPPVKRRTAASRSATSECLYKSEKTRKLVSFFLAIQGTLI